MDEISNFIDNITVNRLAITTTAAAAITAIAAALSAVSAFAACRRHSVWAAIALDDRDPMKITLARLMSVRATDMTITCKDGGYFTVDSVLEVGYGAATLWSEGLKTKIVIRYSEIGSVAVNLGLRSSRMPFSRTYSFNTQ